MAATTGMAEPDEARAFAATVYRALGKVAAEERPALIATISAALRAVADQEERADVRRALLTIAGRGPSLPLVAHDPLILEPANLTLDIAP